MRTSRLAVFIALALVAPHTVRAQATPRPVSYTVVEKAIANLHLDEVRSDFGGNVCFEFSLTPERRIALWRLAQAHDRRAARSTWESIARLIESHPCAGAREPRGTALLPAATSPGGLPPYFGSTAEAHLSQPGFGMGLHYGKQLSPAIDLLANARVIVTGNERLRGDTSSLRAGSVGVAARMWLLRDQGRLAAYIQTGVVGQIEAYKAYNNRANYTGLGLSGDAGLGYFVTPRIFLFVEPGVHWVRVTSREEVWRHIVDEEWESPRSREGLSLRLGLSRFIGGPQERRLGAD